jgi:hypothetical protein
MGKQRKQEEMHNILIGLIEHNKKDLQHTINDSILKEANKIMMKVEESEESWQVR